VNKAKRANVDDYLSIKENELNPGEINGDNLINGKREAIRYFRNIMREYLKDIRDLYKGINNLRGLPTEK
jgi:hypothetical protein